jgi:hypothetical protein
VPALAGERAHPVAMTAKFLAIVSAALLAAGLAAQAGGSGGSSGGASSSGSTSSSGNAGGSVGAPSRSGPSKSSGGTGAGTTTTQTSPLGGTGQPSSIGQPGRTMGQPTTGLRNSTTNQQRPSDIDRTGPSDAAKQIPSPLRDKPASTQPPQFLGSGGKAADGSIPGGSLVALTEEERERIRKIILSQQVAQEPRANFKIMVGAKVPENVSLRPFPQEVLNIVPRYKDFDFVLAADRIIVVQRSTREIDTMIPLKS